MLSNEVPAKAKIKWIKMETLTWMNSHKIEASAKQKTLFKWKEVQLKDVYEDKT